MRSSRVDFTNEAIITVADGILPYAAAAVIPYQHAGLFTRNIWLSFLPVSVSHRLVEDSAVGIMYFPYEAGGEVLSLSSCPVTTTATRKTRVYVVGTCTDNSTRIHCTYYLSSA